MIVESVLGDTCSYWLGELLGEYHKSFHVTPDDGLISRNIYVVSVFIVSILW